MLLPDPFADSGPLQCQFHQGAYMQDNQALHEHCKALELREIQLTTERDTIKSMFEHLASAIQLSKPDPFKLHDSKAIILTSPGSSCPTRRQYPKIQFWSQDNFMSWLDTASSQTTDRGKIPYLEDENGDPVPENTVKAIRKPLQGGWSELLNQKIVPQSWGKVTDSARQLIHMLMEDAYQFFKFADDGWKLDYLATTSYPSWRRNDLDSDDRKSRDNVKKEDNDDDDDNDTNSNEQTGKKRKWSMASIEPKVSSKKIQVKGACNYCYSSSLSPPLSTPAALPAPVVDVPGPENTPSSPDLDSADTTEPIENTIGPLATTENTTKPLVNTNNTTEPLPNTENTTKPLVDTKNTAEPLIDLDETAITVLSNASSKPRSTPAPKPLRITLPNPLSVLALAAAKVDIPPSPPAELDVSPPLESHGPGDPPLEDCTGSNAKKEKLSKASGKGKMCPSPKHNGRNLCTHRWLKQIKTNGTTDKFCVYYGSLNEEQRKEYDNEANTLATENKWNKTINTGKMY
ncbi:uncharacterized protein F5891DRAFT_985231 [Suillus fuscotomentosus]|uniref:Uncharacterized protein n=1 Tax=Suillus fuscotomentosus TaxID=1912939 RepID=A0AAD4DUK8_9AGAM|nr:uncharacterized protein F5891DRAFT_985231 [Suillus fuscotomentosus]KAG1894231.1 hypothetical protein F5891DRAFT_985231 [Suillus fuscotomentosus]